MKRVLAALLFPALAACAPAIPVLVLEPGETRTPEGRPASQIINDKAVTPRDGAGLIIVTSREKAWFATGCTIEVALDDLLVAGLRPGEQVSLFAEPGQRLVGLSVRDEASCGPASARVTLEIIAHTTQKIRVGPDSHNGLKVEVDPFGRSLPP